MDEAVAIRLIAAAGARPGPVYGMQGKPYLRAKIEGYNNAARFAPWVLLVDLDDEGECAPALRTSWLRRPAPFLCFRIAVRAVEAWLMADPESLVSFLHVRAGDVPSDPESERHPKRAMVNLARRSRRAAIRADMFPREGSGRSVGPAYAAMLIEYVRRHWRPDRAAERAESLRRALSRLRRLAEGAHLQPGVTR